MQDGSRRAGRDEDGVDVVVLAEAQIARDHRRPSAAAVVDDQGQAQAGGAPGAGVRLT